MISVVIPVYNEQDNLLPLYSELVAALPGAGPDYEIIFVDDGSTDGSWKIIAELVRLHVEVRGIRFRGNFGKAAALAAGFRAVKGEFVVTLDADLQDDPAEIPKLLRELDTGTPAGPAEVVGTGVGTLDMVSGWKRVRNDPISKVWPSRVFNVMVAALTGVRLHDHNCGMKCYRTEVLRELRLYGELHRFIPVLAAARGFRIGEAPVNHRPRRFGKTKYGSWRFLKGFLDLLTVKFLTGFSRRPQHLLGGFGLLSFLFGNLALAYLAVTWVIRLWRPNAFEPLHERPLLIYALAALLMGAQMMSIGFLAELMTAYQGRDEDSYSIAEEQPPATHEQRQA